jgi:hypothetical protein
MNRNGLVSDVAFGVGAAGIAVGVVALVLSGGSHEPGTKPRIVVRGRGVSVVGSF